MASKADDDHNTPSVDSWWFLNPELSQLAKPALVFVAQWTWHEKPAKEFLWDGAARGSIRWYAEIEILEDNPVFKMRAGLLTFNTAVNQGLWHPDYFTMDWETSRGIYVGPAILLIRNPECPEQTAVKYDGRVSVRIVARLMRFHRGDIVRELRRCGLMQGHPLVSPAAAVEEAAVEEAAVEEAAVEEAAVEEAAVEEAAVEKTTAPTIEQCEQPLTKQHRWQLDRAVSALRKRYPPDGKAPFGKTIKAVRGEIDGDLAAENKRLGKATPSWDVVKEAIELLGRNKSSDPSDLSD
jgi:hypothetical protein